MKTKNLLNFQFLTSKYSINVPWLVVLAIIGIICGFLWNYEAVKIWSGLAWVNHDFIAIPVSFLLFFIWYYLSILEYPIKKRLILLAVSIIVSYFLFELSVMILRYHFVSGPSAMLFYLGTNKVFVFLMRNAIFVLPVIIFSVLFIVFLHFQKDTSSFPFVIGGFLMYLFSFLSVALQYLVKNSINGEYYTRDFLHAIKSGLMLPFIIFSLGLPFLIKKDKI